MKIGQWQIWTVILSGVVCGALVSQGIQSAPPDKTVEAVDPDSLEGIVGKHAPVAFDDNEMVASVAEAVREGKHHERLSAMILPADFDADGYKKSPATYLNTVEPGRVWQAKSRGRMR